MDKNLAASEKMTFEEKRRRKHLKRVREVELIKRRIKMGTFGALVLVIGIIAVVSNGGTRETFSGNNGMKAETFSENGSSVEADQRGVSYDTSERGAYLEIIEDLADTDERYQKILNRQEEYPENVLRMCTQNEEVLDFVVDYPDKKNSQAASSVGEVIKGEVPLLLQWDSRWGYAPYGDSTIVAVSGCGPTCIAMVACGLTGRDDITPAVVAEYSAANGFLTAANDTTWDLMSYGCQTYGITGWELGLDKAAMINQLDAGHPLIASMSPGDFTQGGHFIVITGYDGTGFTVNDPNSKIRSGQKWTFERLSGQIKNLWYYTLTD